MWRLYVVILTVAFIAFFCIFRVYDYRRNDVSKLREIKTNKTSQFEHRVPKLMLELYEEIRLNPNITPPDVVRSILPKNQGFEIFGEVNKEHHHLLFFEIPHTNHDEMFVKAELKILTLIMDEDKNNIFDSWRHLIVLSTYNENEKKLSLIEKKYVVHKKSTWITFNLTKIVNDAIEENSFDVKLAVSLISLVPSLEGKLKLSLAPKKENYEHDYPILLLTYTSNKKENFKRPKRSLNEDDVIERKTKNSCRKRSMFVNFSDIYYNRWIIQPQGYEAFQCQGKCFYPMAQHLSPSKHAVIQSLMHSLNPTIVSKVCCVPTKLASISILYVENGILTYRYAYKDMVVSECGCR